MTQSAYTTTPEYLGQGSNQSTSVRKSPTECCVKESTSEGNATEETLSQTENDKFELLSAYIDNEVSEIERQQVERWLVLDARLQQQYKAQLKLSQAMKSLLE